ncbi:MULTISPECIES: hypothetical protein [Streptomyces]|nr:MULTISPECIES: hypothetical protein [Streptomyces]
MAEPERDYIRDKTLEGQETARTKGKAIGGTKVSDEDMLATPRRLRDELAEAPAGGGVDSRSSPSRAGSSMNTLVIILAGARAGAPGTWVFAVSGGLTPRSR